MTTKNVFDLTKEAVTLTVFDMTPVNGDKPENPKELAKHVFELESIPEELADGDNPVKTLAAYGLSRLLQDRCSDYTDKRLEGDGLSVQEVADTRVAAYQAVYEVLVEGQFRARRESKGKQAAVDTFFAQALCDFLKEQGKDMDINTATVYLQSRNNEERKALRSKLQAHINKAREAAREAASNLDLDELLG